MPRGVLLVGVGHLQHRRQRGRRHKKLTDWARQTILQLRRWLPHRPLVLVSDNSYAVLDLLHCCQSLAQPVTLIARLRLDAALYAPAPPRQPGQNGRPPLKRRRLPALKALPDLPAVSWIEVPAAWYDGTTRTVELTSQTAVWYRSGKPPVPLRWVLVRDPKGEFTPQALLCTDPSADPTQILEWFVLRWQPEVTFQEVRTHLGVETQRQWPDRAIARTTPILMGIFSWSTLAAHLLRQQRPSAHRTAAWYAKPSPTFVDAIALVRRHLWLASEVFHCPPPTLIYGKSRPFCTTDLSIPSITPPEMRKVQSTISPETQSTITSASICKPGKDPNPQHPPESGASEKPESATNGKE